MNAISPRHRALYRRGMGRSIGPALSPSWRVSNAVQARFGALAWALVPALLRAPLGALYWARLVRYIERYASAIGALGRALCERYASAGSNAMRALCERYERARSNTVSRGLAYYLYSRMSSGMERSVAQNTIEKRRSALWGAGSAGSVAWRGVAQ